MFLCMAFLLAPAAGCREGDAPCRQSPVGEVTVFLEGESGTSVFTGTVVSIQGPDEAALRTYRFLDAANAERVLRFAAPGDSLPVEVGSTYGVSVTTVPGMPTPNSVLISRDGVFRYAAASDYEPGRTVFIEPPAGFEISMEGMDCGDRDRNPCFESEINGRLRVARGDDSARLVQGESAVVDGVRLTCLTARFLEYSDECADAGAFGVSYTMRAENRELLRSR